MKGEPTDVKCEWLKTWLREIRTMKQMVEMWDALSQSRVDRLRSQVEILVDLSPLSLLEFNFDPKPHLVRPLVKAAAGGIPTSEEIRLACQHFIEDVVNQRLDTLVSPVIRWTPHASRMRMVHAPTTPARCDVVSVCICDIRQEGIPGLRALWQAV